MTASISFKKSHRQVSGNKKTLPVSRPVQALNRNHQKAHMVFWQYRGSSSFVLKEGKFRTYAQQALWLPARFDHDVRSEEHTSELQSRGHLVCRLLLEKEK